MKYEYLELWPRSLGDLDVGEEITFTPELRHYSRGTDGYTVIGADESYFETEIYNYDAYQLLQTETEGKVTYILKRLNNSQSSFRVKAFIFDEYGSTQWVDDIEYWLNEYDYSFWYDIRGNDQIFSDGTRTFGFDLVPYENKEFELVPVVGTGAWSDETGSFETTLAEGDGWSYNADDHLMTFDGSVLSGKGIDRIETRIEARLGGIAVWIEWRGFDVREAKYDHDFRFGDTALLPGWDYKINKYFGCHVENGTYPDGSDFELEITNVQVDDDDVFALEQTGDDFWRFKAANFGTTGVTITYTDYDGSEKTYEFTVDVTGDVYNVDMWTTEGTDRALPGGSVTYQANARHEAYYADDNHYDTYTDDRIDGLRYVWSIYIWDDYVREQLADNIVLTVDENDPARATVSFNNIPDEFEYVDVEVRVAYYENEDLRAEQTGVAFMSHDYLELWPRSLGDLDVGEEITFIPEIRHYVRGTDGYTVIPADETVFETEIYDPNAYTLEEKQVGGKVAYTVKRLTDYDSSFRVKAFISESNGDIQWADEIEYWLNGQDYSFWYDIRGNDQIFSDGTRTFGFDLVPYENKEFELVPVVGTGAWSDETGSFETTLAEGDGWSYNADDHLMTFDGSVLFGKGIDRVETRIEARIGGITVWTEWRGFDVCEAEYYFDLGLHGVLFPGEERYMPATGTGFVRSTEYPDGADVSFLVRGVTVSGPITCEADGNNGWKITAGSAGEGIVKADISLEPDDANVSYEPVITVPVATRRAYMNLMTDIGGYRFVAPGSIKITPRIYVECYDTETGSSYYDDSANYDVAFDAWVSDASPYITDPSSSWFCETADNGRSLVVTSRETAEPGMNILVTATLTDPETNEELCVEECDLVTGKIVHMLELVDTATGDILDWNEDILTGDFVTVMPRVMVYGIETEPRAIETFDTSDLTYRLGWYPGSGNDWDPAHLIVTDKNGTQLVPDTWITSDVFPLTIRRNVAWKFDFNMEAKWCENALNEYQSVYANYGCNHDVEVEAGFRADKGRGDENYTMYFYYEPIRVEPITDSLEIVQQIRPDVQVTYEVGIYDAENEVMNPIVRYGAPDEVTGKRGEAEGEFDMSPYFNAQTGVLSFTEDQLAELEAFQENLAYQIDEYGDRPFLNLRMKVELDGRVLDDKIFTVNIFTPTCSLMNYDYDIKVGESTFISRNAVIHLYDAEHEDGEYEVMITGITLTNSKYVNVTEGEDGWTVEALWPTESYLPFDAAFASKDGSVMNNGRPMHLAVVIGHDHTVEEWTVVKEATIFEPGLKTGTCKYCDETMTAEIPQLVPSIVLSETSAAVDKTMSTAVTVIFENGDAIDSVTSSDMSIASASFSGNAVTVQAGTTAGSATITVTLLSGLSADISVFVPRVDADSVSVEPASGKVLVGKTLQLAAAMEPVNCDSTVSYESSDTAVATVSETGVVTGVAAGTVTITVTTDNGKTAEASITVQPLTESLTTDKTSYTVDVGKTVTIKTTKNPTDSGQSISYKSSDRTVATVTSKGVVKGVKKGTATITIKSGSITKTVKVTVKIPTTALTTNKTAYTVTTRSTVTIKATKTPTNSSYGITYTSADKAIATVSSTGVIKGVKVGTTTITVKSGSVKKKVKVTVKQGTNKITTDKTSYSVKKGKTVTIKAVKKPSTSADKITFSSSNKSVATVTSKGVVKGIKKGTVTITIKSGAITKKVKVTVT